MEPASERYVIVGVDGSPSSTVAALWAADEAHRRKCSLHIVAAYQPAVAYGGPGVIIPSLLEAPRLVAEEDVERTLATIRSDHPDLPMTTIVSLDTPFGALREASADAELVVVGSHGQGVAGETLLGSVAQKMVSRSTAPVAVIRTDPHAGSASAPRTDGPVVVGVDGSVGSEVSLCFAFDEAALREIELVAVRCWDDSVLNGFLRVYPVEVDRAEIDQREERDLRDQLEPWQHKYSAVAVRPTVKRGRATRALLRVSEELHPSLLVLGGRGGFTGLLLGSVGHETAAYADCPVVVVHHPAADDQAG